MNALGWLFLVLMLIITGFAVSFAWFCSSELLRVQRLHARHGAPARGTARHDATREPRTALLGAETTARPDENASVHLWGPPVDVYQQMQLKLKEHGIGPGACPWAPPEQPAVVRQTMIRDLTGPMPACTDEETREMYHREPDVTESVTAWRPGDVTYGQAPQGSVEEAERQDAGLLT